MPCTPNLHLNACFQRTQLANNYLEANLRQHVISPTNISVTTTKVQDFVFTFKHNHKQTNKNQSKNKAGG